MNSRQNSKAFFPFSLALLLCGTSGLAFNAGIAEAKPRNQAPAWGYRCRNGEQVQRGGNFDCDKVRNRGNQDRNQERDRDDDFSNDDKVRNRGNQGRNQGRDRDRNRDDDSSNRDRDNFNTGILPAGTVLNVQYSGLGQIIIRRNERYPLTLSITSDITDSSGAILIPRDSTIEGEFQPVNGGVRFVARRLNLSNGGSYSINAISRVISSNNDLALGGLGGTTVSDVLGSVLGGDRTIRGNSDLIAINPGNNFQLTLRSNLRVR